MVNKLKKLEWCFSKKEVKLIEPNENLAKEYLKSAEETLIVLKNIAGKSNMWLATTKYYCEYFACYSLLMHLGIKSEIHDCTIEILKFLEKQGIIEKGIAKTLKEDKELRMDNQYYLKNRDVFVDYNKLRDFVLKIKEIIFMISNEKIDEVRNKIKKII